MFRSFIYLDEDKLYTYKKTTRRIRFNATQNDYQEKICRL